MVEEYHVVTEVVTKYESPELEPLIQVGERDILNYLGHENLSGARHGHYAGRGGAPGRETNEKGEIREISEGDAGECQG